MDKIGKDCGQYNDKFTSWEDLMTSSSEKMKENGIPVKQRRWILHWRHKYKAGEEPYTVKFKSKARKNKDKRKQIFMKHITPIYKKQDAKYREKQKLRKERRAEKVAREGKRELTEMEKGQRKRAEKVKLQGIVKEKKKLTLRQLYKAITEPKAKTERKSGDKKRANKKDKNFEDK